jgi:hypothetical protein
MPSVDPSVQGNTASIVSAQSGGQGSTAQHAQRRSAGRAVQHSMLSAGQQAGQYSTACSAQISGQGSTAQHVQRRSAGRAVQHDMLSADQRAGQYTTACSAQVSGQGSTAQHAQRRLAGRAVQHSMLSAGQHAGQYSTACSAQVSRQGSTAQHAQRSAACHDTHIRLPTPNNVPRHHAGRTSLRGVPKRCMALHPARRCHTSAAAAASARHLARAAWPDTADTPHVLASLDSGSTKLVVRALLGQFNVSMCLLRCEEAVQAQCRRG